MLHSHNPCDLVIGVVWLVNIRIRILRIRIRSSNSMDSSVELPGYICKVFDLLGVICESCLKGNDTNMSIMMII